MLTKYMSKYSSIESLLYDDLIPMYMVIDISVVCAIIENRRPSHITGVSDGISQNLSYCNQASVVSILLGSDSNTSFRNSTLCSTA